MQNERSERNTSIENIMSFLKSFCGREFVNKNDNLHKNPSFPFSCLQQNIKFTRRVKVKQRLRVRKNIYLNKIRSIHYRIAWNNF